MLDRDRLWHFAPGDGIAAGAQTMGCDDGKWLASVPVYIVSDPADVRLNLGLAPQQ